MLEICLLGSPEIKGNNCFLSIPRRQARALLYRLSSRLEPIPREKLCFLFWPDVPENNARRNLSHLLTHVRRALPNHAMLLTEGDHVWLDPELTWSDTAVFAQLETPLLPKLQTQTVLEIVDLYRGPFLAGFSLPGSVEFETWITCERQIWERLYLDRLFALVKEWTVKGAYEVAIRYAERYLATNSLSEEVHRHLIALYAANGDRAAALHQFEQCVVVLERELGVRPLPETRATYETVLKGKIPPVYLAAEKNFKTLSYLKLSLIGREGEMRLLQQAYSCAQSGQMSIVLVSGEPGIGKSRLIQEFLMGISEQTTILVGDGRPGMEKLSYQPIVQALSPVIPNIFAAFKGNPIWLVEASRLWPELRLSLSSLPQPMAQKGGGVHLRLYESLCRIVLDLCERSRCLVLCMEDIHWMDERTLDWIVYLVGRLRQARLLILGSYCCDAVNAVKDLQLGLRNQNNLIEMNLNGLDETAVCRLLHQLVGSMPNANVTTRLHQLTGGNPFFILEIVDALRNSGHSLSHLPSLEDLPISDAIHTVVNSRLAPISLVTQQVLEACAVLPSRFSFNQVQQIAGRREMETIDGLDELVARHLLLQKGNRYRFQHNLMRRMVLENLNPVRRQLLLQRSERFGSVSTVK